MNHDLVLAGSFALNFVGLITTSWMLRRMSLLEGELRGLRAVLSALSPASPSKGRR